MSRSWASIWEDLSFWRRNNPARHFDTPSTLATALLARWLIQTARDFGCITLIEIGFGNGHLQTEIARLAPDVTRIGVDIRSTPTVECQQLIQQWDTATERWLTVTGNPAVAGVWPELKQPVLLFAVEWLDDLAAEIVERDSRGALRTLGPHGAVGTPGPADTAWAERWWPQQGRLAIGRSRDAAWRWLARHLPSGSVLTTVDYGHIRAERPADGGFLAYRDGCRVVPDETANLTAAVAVDSLAAAVEGVGCERLAYSRLADLPAGHWTSSAGDALTTLSLRSQEQLLRDPRRFGGFWLVQHRTPRPGQRRGAETLLP